MPFDRTKPSASFQYDTNSILLTSSGEADLPRRRQQGRSGSVLPPLSLDADSSSVQAASTREDCSVVLPHLRHLHRVS